MPADRRSREQDDPVFPTGAAGTEAARWPIEGPTDITLGMRLRRHCTAAQKHDRVVFVALAKSDKPITSCRTSTTG